jgi:hypothetical protein
MRAVDEEAREPNVLVGAGGGVLAVQQDPHESGKFGTMPTGTNGVSPPGGSGVRVASSHGPGDMGCVVLWYLV